MFVYRNVFIGVKNPISVSCMNNDANDFKLHSNVGRVDRLIKNRYYLEVPVEENKEFVFLSLIKKSNNQVIQSEKRKLNRLPSPTVYVGHANLNETQKIEKKILDHIEGIYARLDSSLTNENKVDYNVIIKSFTIKKNLNQKGATSTSGRFSLEQKKLIENSNVGDSLFISNVLLINLDGNICKVDSLKLRII